MTRRQVQCFKLKDDNDEKGPTSFESQTEVSIKEVLNINIQHNELTFSSVTENITDLTLKTRLERLIEEYTPMKTEDTGVEMKIILTDNIPVYQNPRRLDPEQNKTVNGIISDWKEKCIVRDSISDYASPVVLAKKKKWRLSSVHRLQEGQQENSERSFSTTIN